MKFRIAVAAMALVLLVTTSSFAADPKLDGAYKFVGLKFDGGAQTEADAKGMIVVHGKYIAFVRAGVNRPKWTQEEAETERNKKVVAAFMGLAATAGTFEIQGNTIILQQVAQAVPTAMGTTTKWEFKVDGKRLVLKPGAAPGVEFTFERLP